MNQHFFINNEVIGLEEQRIPLFKLIESFLKEFDSQYRGHSYWISVRFCRPIGSGSTNKKAIIKALSEFLNEPPSLPYSVAVTENIHFRIWPRQSVEGEVFRFAIGTDKESGGFVLSEFKRNFDHCIKQKSEKIKSHLYKYTVWWLVLIDTIAYSFDEANRREVKLMITMNPIWDKVIVLDGIKGKNILEINNTLSNR